MKYNYKLCPKCGKYKDMPDGTIIATNTTVNPFCVCLETLAEQQGVKPFDAAKIGTFPDCPIIEHPDYSCAACVEKDARVAELEAALEAKQQAFLDLRDETLKNMRGYLIELESVEGVDFLRNMLTEVIEIADAKALKGKEER